MSSDRKRLLNNLFTLEAPLTRKVRRYLDDSATGPQPEFSVARYLTELQRNDGLLNTRVLLRKGGDNYGQIRTSFD